MANNLTPEMQERLDKWRKSVEDGSPKLVRDVKQTCYVSRRDYGDEIEGMDNQTKRTR
jgi:hypothetical protein